DAAAPLAEILKRISETVFDAGVPQGVHPFLEIRVLDDGPDPARRRTIERALEGKPVRLASIRLEPPHRTTDALFIDEEFASTLSDLASLDPEEMMRSAYVERYQSDPDPSLLSALRQILSETAHAK